MILDFKRAFTYFMEDEKWLSKLLILSFISIITNFLNVFVGQNIESWPYIILMMVFNFGFFILLLNNLLNKEIKLPDVNLLKILKYGLKFSLVYLSYLLIFGILTIVVLLVSSIMFGIAAAFGVSKVIISVLFVILYLPLILAYVLYAGFSHLAFGENLKYNDSFKIIRIFKLFINNWHRYAGITVLYVLFITSQFMFSFISPIFENKIIYFTVLSLFTIIHFILAFAFCYLYSEVYKHSLCKINNTEYDYLSPSNVSCADNYKIISSFVVVCVLMMVLFFISPKITYQEFIAQSYDYQANIIKISKLIDKNEDNKAIMHIMSAPNPKDNELNIWLIKNEASLKPQYIYVLADRIYDHNQEEALFWYFDAFYREHYDKFGNKKDLSTVKEISMAKLAPKTSKYIKYNKEKTYPIAKKVRDKYNKK